MRRYRGGLPLCKETVSEFKPMTNWSSRCNFIAAPGLPSPELKANPKKNNVK